MDVFCVGCHGSVLRSGGAKADDPSDCPSSQASGNTFRYWRSYFSSFLRLQIIFAGLFSLTVMLIFTINMPPECHGWIKYLSIIGVFVSLKYLINIKNSIISLPTFSQHLNEETTYTSKKGHHAGENPSFQPAAINYEDICKSD